MYSITIFKSPRFWKEKERYVYDNKTHRSMSFDTWDMFVGFLENLSKKSISKKQDAQLISPAIFKPNSKRRNDNVIGWSQWCAVDVDNVNIGRGVKGYVDSIVSGWTYFCYSTASSTKDTPKFRIVFPLNRDLEKSEIKHFWFALNKELGSIGDEQTKDLSRMYYIPANYAGANNFTFKRSGTDIDVDVLLSKHPYTERSHNFIDNLPEDIQKQIIEHRKNQLTNTNHSWTHYSDCPFVNKKLINEYKSIAHSDGTGRYAMIYKIMTSIAVNAIRREYPISAKEIVHMVLQLDKETSNRYNNRALDLEANRAIEFAYRSA